MRNIVTLLLVFCIVSANHLFASQVNQSRAQNVALNFYKLNATASTKNSATAQLTLSNVEDDGTINFYVFNISPGPGFVIVSGDDVFKPVLAYSTESNFVSGLNQTGVVDWTKHAVKYMEQARLRNAQTSSEITNFWNSYDQGINPVTIKSNVVTPLCHTFWNQEPYYNNLCPFNTADNERAVTGCVATAMAQIMKFWNFPPQGVGTNSYDSYGYGTQSANFGSTQYHFEEMPMALTLTNDPNGRIVTLMYQCGVSVDMDYGDDNQGGSGAFVLQAESWGGVSAQSAYAANFSYNANLMQGVYASDNSGASWTALLEGELNIGRPLQYEGDDTNGAGGHTWVCDGYDANDMLHMNWGWGGSDNGYYVESNLDAGGYNFDNNEAALIGIEPIMSTVIASTTRTTVCSGDFAILSAHTLSSQNITYSWTPTTGLSCPSCATTNAAPLVNTTYTVQIDSAGIIGTSSLTISVTQGITAYNGNSTNASCYGGADGTAGVTAVGGTPDYAYNWSNGEVGATATGLAAGTYQVTVTDTKGCSAVTTQVIGQASQIDATATTTDAGCTSATGSATLSTSGGAGGYSYIWSNGTTGSSLTNALPGNYTVTVTDANSCTAVSSITVNQPYQIQFSVNTTPAISGQSNGSATIDNLSAGTAPYSYSWSNGESTQTATGLGIGSYTASVTDANGCYQTETVIVGATTAINNVSEPFSFSVYPNPAKTSVLLQLSKLSNGTSLKLTNVLGQTLLTKPISELQTQLDLSDFANGMYLLQITQGDKQLIKQLVVNR